MGELLIGALGPSLVLRLAPSARSGRWLGAWYGATALGFWLAGRIGGWWDRVPHAAHRHAVPLELPHLVRIVRHELDAAHADREAGRRVVESHLRLVASMVRQHRGALSTTDDLKQVLFGEGGLVAGATRPRLVVDSSSISQEGSAEIRTRLEALGVAYLCAPVSGNAKVAKAGNDKEAQRLVDVLNKCQAALNEGKPVRGIDFSKEERAILKPLCLITAKPAMFVGNVSETGFENNPFLDRLKDFAAKQNAPVVAICAKTEAELAEMADDDRAMFLAEMGQDEPGLNRLIRAGFKLLGLQTYFTAGVKEVRAWTIHIGDTAPQAAGVIHTDFEKGFIRAQTIAFDDFIQYKGEAGAKDAGKMRAEGKEHVVKDGDVLNFLFNV